MKIIFFGTSAVALPILNALQTQHDIVAAVTSPDAPVGRKALLTPSPVADLASKLNIPTLKPENIKNDIHTFEQLRENVNNGVEIFIVVSYGKILPEKLINLPPLKTLNIHFSLLPKYRGAAPVQHAILNGDTQTGTTIFILDGLLDHGQILAQKEIDILPDDTTPRLLEKISVLSADLLLNILPKYAARKIIPQEQTHEQSTKAGIIKKEDGKIDWTKTAGEIYNQWKAFQPWPGIFTYFNGKLLKIIECKPLFSIPAKEVSPNMQIGTVLPNGSVACGKDTFLQIQKLQLEGAKPLDIKEFTNGHNNFIGTNLI